MKQLFDVNLTFATPARMFVVADSEDDAVKIAGDICKEQVRGSLDEYGDIYQTDIQASAVAVKMDPDKPIKNHYVANLHADIFTATVQDWINFLTGRLEPGTMKYQILAEACGQMTLFGKPA